MLVCLGGEKAGTLRQLLLIFILWNGQLPTRASGMRSLGMIKEL
jgi:hypothetical protein